MLQNKGHVCLGILDGSNVNDGSSIILGGSTLILNENLKAFYFFFIIILFVVFPFNVITVNDWIENRGLFSFPSSFVYPRFGILVSLLL